MLKRVLCLTAACCLATTAFAASHKTVAKHKMATTNYQLPSPTAKPFNPGVYYGMQGGVGVTGWRALNGIYTVSKDMLPVVRAFTGYEINRHFAVEAGLTYFNFGGKTKLNGVATRLAAADIMGKLTVPVCNNFAIYGKAGVDYLFAFMGSLAKNHGRLNMAFGAGVEYDFTSHIIGDISWTRFGGRQKLNPNVFVPTADMYALGLRYKFDIK